jgi:hypothetical protein
VHRLDLDGRTKKWPLRRRHQLTTMILYDRLNNSNELILLLAAVTVLFQLSTGLSS